MTSSNTNVVFEQLAIDWRLVNMKVCLFLFQPDTNFGDDFFGWYVSFSLGCHGNGRQLPKESDDKFSTVSVFSWT